MIHRFRFNVDSTSIETFKFLTEVLLSNICICFGIEFIKSPLNRGATLRGPIESQREKIVEILGTHWAKVVCSERGERVFAKFSTVT